MRIVLAKPYSMFSVLVLQSLYNKTHLLTAHFCIDQNDKIFFISNIKVSHKSAKNENRYLINILAGN